MFWHVSVWLSTPMGGGGSSLGGGSTPAGGYPLLARGTPPQVTPPPIRPGAGLPHLGYPPSDLGLGGTPPWVPPPVGPGRGGGTPPRVVLDTPRSVCLLRSHRRTFLFFLFFSFFLSSCPSQILDWTFLASWFKSTCLCQFVRLQCPPITHSLWSRMDGREIDGKICAFKGEMYTFVAQF